MKAFFLILGVFILSSCGNSKKQEKEENVQQILPTEAVEVMVTPLERKVFVQELVSNGKIVAKKMAELHFKSAEPITKIAVKNGDHVNKGDLVASLNTFIFENDLKQAKDDLENSKLSLQDLLIGRGYKLDELDSVPTQMMELIKIKSGYNKAQNRYEMAQFNYERATLIAPISGVVANLSSKTNTIANTSKVFCNIIDLKSMEVAFSVLENELGLIQKGNEIKISPFSMPDVQIAGKISEINPWVDENGMVKVKASIDYHPKMVEGMSVRVSIFRELEEQWVVPKTAVVIRTGKQAVFVYKGGKALWNYVTTGLENSNEYSITSETLKEGDQVIISNNINLAHESTVEVIEE